MDRSTEQKIDDLLDALECGTEGVKLVAQALSDRHREVRQSAFLLLSDLNETIAKEALWNYLPFAEMQCLHTITKFNSSRCDPRENSPDYFAIANYNNTLLCYWDVTYRSSFINIWDLETGERKYDFDSSAHEFGIGKQGRVCLVNYQHLIWVVNTETHNMLGKYPDCLMSVTYTHPGCFAVCPTNKPLVVTGYSVGWQGEFEVWNYETYTCYLHYQFENMVTTAHWQSKNLPQDELLRYKISPFVFTPNGKFLVVRFQRNRYSCILQLWNLESRELLQTIDNLPLLAVNGLAIRSSDREILACGK